jgi:hypothetical protein
MTAQAAQLADQAANLQATQQALAPTLTALVQSSPTPAATLAVTPGAPTAPAGTVATQADPNGPPVISVSADTNCRQGPGTLFPIVSLLAVGKTTAVQGKDASGQWYYVTNPSGSGSCWLWGQYATLTGNTANLEVVSAPPAPTAATGQPVQGSITISFVNIHQCGDDVVTLLVQNGTTSAFRSARVTVREPVSGETLGQYGGDNVFLPGENACPPGRSTLAPGETAYLIGAIDATLPEGADGRAIVMICTEAGLNGECDEQRLDFVFPN